MKKIQVEKYNLNWKREFEKAKLFYKNLLSGVKVKIEHVGSTSVEGLWAKPILDIDIIVSNNSDSLKVIGQLENVGYKHLGNLGIEGREAFENCSNNPNIHWMDHNLYVCLDGCENLRNHLLLRDHLRKNKTSVKLYSNLKLELAKKYSDDIDSYIDGKTDLITSFLKQEGMNTAELDRIKSINLVKFKINDYEEVHTLWRSDPNIGLSSSDSKENIGFFLSKNENTCFLLKDGNKAIGSILCGNDGRRGYIHHLFVDKKYRKNGCGRLLLDTGLDSLKKEGICKCHILIFCNNKIGQSFWKRNGFVKRDDLFVFSKCLC